MLPPQPARSAAAAKTAAQPVTAPDFVQVAKKKDEVVLSAIEKNPVYKLILDGASPKEQRIQEVLNYLLAGVQEGTVKVEELDQRRQALTEFNAFVQIVRKQLGSQQAQEITNKAYADFQRIVTQTTEDVGRFEQELAPLGKLADLFSKYGADGNIIEKINLAKYQKETRDRTQSSWQYEHKVKVDRLQKLVDAAQADLDSKWFGWSKSTAETVLTQAQQRLTTAQAETPPVQEATTTEVEQVDEGILELQNIGGPKFKEAVSSLREHTEEALAKISANFDEAIEGLTNTRASFIQMDRNCSDADFALSILQTAVQEAEKKSQDIAKSLTTPNTTSDSKLAELDRMENERKSSMLLTYTESLTTFLKDIGVAVASLRSGKAVISNVLRMNKLALESANTHKITGIANTADAVTIIIGSIIEVCNRAAGQALADGLSSMRRLAEAGNQRLAEGTYESLQLQNDQLQSFVDSVASLKDMTNEITANSVDLLKQQFALVKDMQAQSAALADSTTEAQRTSFAARAGAVDSPKEEAKPEHTTVGLGIRVPG